MWDSKSFRNFLDFFVNLWYTAVLDNNNQRGLEHNNEDKTGYLYTFSTPSVENIKHATMFF